MGQALPAIFTRECASWHFAFSDARNNDFQLYYDANEIEGEFDSAATCRIGLGPWKVCLYDILMGFWERHSNRDAMRLIEGAGQPERILELGVGSGHLLSLLATRFPQSEIFGVDYSSGMIEASKRLLYRNKHSMAQVRFVKCDCFHLPDGLDGQDMIASSFLFDIQPYERIEHLLKESARVLKPDGRLFVAVLDGALESSRRSWLERKFFSMANSFYRLCYRSEGLRWLSHKLFKGYYTHCRPIDIEACVERSGLFSIRSSAVSSIRICGVPFLPVRIIEAVKR